MQQSAKVYATLIHLTEQELEKLKAEVIELEANRVRKSDTIMSWKSDDDELEIGYDDELEIGYGDELKYDGSGKPA
jgi:hypothetical protein